MSSPPALNIPSTGVITAIVAVPHSVACVTTLARLVVQHRTRKLLWDDLWAGFAQVCAIALWAVSMQLPMGGAYSRPLQILSIVGMLLFYTAALWAAKISVAVTIVKLIAPGTFRTCAKWAACVFGLMWMALSLQRLFACGANFEVMPFCRVPVYTGYLELGTDLVSDIWLIGAPVVILWKIKLSLHHRRLIGGVFACGIATTAASIAHIYYIIIKDDIWTGLTGHIQVGVSLVVCNLLVLATFVYRRLHHLSNTSETTTTPDLSADGGTGSDDAHPSPAHTPHNQHETKTADIVLTEIGSSVYHHRGFDEEYTANIESFGEAYTQNTIGSYDSKKAGESGITSHGTRISFPPSHSENISISRSPQSSFSSSKK